MVDNCYDGQCRTWKTATTTMKDTNEDDDDDVDELRNHGYLGPGGSENDPGGGDWVGGA